MPESARDLLDRIRLAEDESLQLKEVVLASRKMRGPARTSPAMRARTGRRAMEWLDVHGRIEAGRPPEADRDG